MIFDATWWSSVGPSVAGSFVTSAVFVGLSQIALKAGYDRKLEGYKAELAVENARELERIRHDGEIAAERLKKSFGLLAERQAEVVEELYLRLARLHLALKQMISTASFGGEPTEIERIQSFEEARWSALTHFREKRLYVPPETASRVQKIIMDMSGSGMVYRYTLANIPRNAREWERQRELCDRADGPMEQMLRELEVEFRQLLRGETI